MGVMTGPMGGVTGSHAPNGMSSSSACASLNNSFEISEEAIYEVIKFYEDKDLLKMIDVTVFKVINCLITIKCSF